MNQLTERLTAALPEPFGEIALALLAAAVGVALALLVHWTLYTLASRLAAKSESTADDIVVERLRRPTRWAAVALGVVLTARQTALAEAVWQHLAGFVMPPLIGWIALAAFNAFVEIACTPLAAPHEFDLEARRRRTRLAILSRIVTGVVIFLIVGLMLLAIPGVREIGVTLMASAGIAGLAVGAAAQPALKSLIAGMQMALTEPVSIDDLVVIDGFTGRIEDIRSAFVVLRTWDERRVVVPTSRFLEQTFENWTRAGNVLTGPILLRLDPATDVAALRTAFETYLAGCPAWDKRTQAVQVTDMTAGSIEVRLVVSAASPGDLSNLGFEVREAMLAWIRENQPRALITAREVSLPYELPPPGYSGANLQPAVG